MTAGPGAAALAATPLYGDRSSGVPLGSSALKASSGLGAASGRPAHRATGPPGPLRMDCWLRRCVGLTSAWTISGEVNHRGFLWWVDYDIPNLRASPAKNELQQNLTVRLRGGHDRRRQLVSACPRARLVG